MTVCFSPDSKLVAVGCIDSTITILDRAMDLRVQRRFKHEEGKHVRGLAFHPNGLRLASLAIDSNKPRGHEGKVWDVASGKELVTLQNSSRLFRLHYTADGKQLVGHDNSEIQLWDAETGLELRTIACSSRPNALALCPLGARIVSGNTDGTLSIFDRESGREIRNVRGHSDQVTAVAVSSNGKLIASGSADSTVRLWNAESGQEISVFRGHLGPVGSIHFHPTEAQLVSCGESGGKTWDITRVHLDYEEIEANRAIAGEMQFSPEGRRLFIATHNGDILLCDAGTGVVLGRFQDHTATVQCLRINRAGTRLLSGSSDKTARIWNAKTREVIHTLSGHAGNVRSVVWHPYGSRVLTASDDGTAIVWNAFTGLPIKRLEIDRQQIEAVAISPTAEWVAFLADATIEIWDPIKGTRLKNFAVDPRESDVDSRGRWARPVASMEVSPDSKHVVVSYRGGGMTLWNAETGKIVGSTILGRFTGVSAGDTAVFSPCGRRILVNRAFDNRLALWDVAQMQETLLLERGSYGRFSPDGSRIAALGDRLQTILIWDSRRAWRPVTVVGGNWQIDADELVQTTLDKATRLVFGPEVSEYDFSFRAKSESGSHGFKAVFHHLDGRNQCEFALGNYFNKATDLSTGYDGQWTRQPGMYREEKIEFGRWYDVRLEVRGPKVNCLVDGNLVFSATDPRFTRGRIGFSTWEAVARFRDIEVRSPEGDVLWSGLPAVPEETAATSQSASVAGP
jgi:WD40 repeat protein